jgi:hypothetical protein
VRPHAGRWLAARVELYRGVIVAWSVMLGLLLGGLILLADRQFDEGRKRDRQIREAVARLDALERPSPAEIRRLIRRLLRGLTPEQAREIRERAVRPEPFGGGGRSPGTGPQSPPRPPPEGGGQPEPPGLIPELPPLPCLPVLCSSGPPLP